jgi:hypothetical protein
MIFLSVCHPAVFLYYVDGGWQAREFYEFQWAWQDMHLGVNLLAIWLI